MRKISRQGWIRKNWELCRQIVKLRANGRCEICKREGREVDHCFSRGNKETFYMIENLSLLCSECHSHKTYRRYGYDLRVYELVQEREGIDKFIQIREVSERRGGFHEWQYIVYHEQKNIELKEKLAEFMSRVL